MASHEQFRELCAAAIAGELSASEETALNAHLAVCPACRRVKSEYEGAALRVAVALSKGQEPQDDEAADDSWTIDEAEEAFFKRLDKERPSSPTECDSMQAMPAGKRFAYRPSRVRWREIWMPFAAATVLALSLGITAYRSGLKRGTGDARPGTEQATEAASSLEEQVSDAGHERAQLQAKLAESVKLIEDLQRKLSDQFKLVNALKSTQPASRRTSDGRQSAAPREGAAPSTRDAELAAAQGRLAELQKTVQQATAQRDENARQAAGFEAKVNELTQLVNSREQALERKEVELTNGQELLEHDRDIRELMGAPELYMADVHDVSGKGTAKTYGRVFYTKGKSLIFYAFDLDTQPGVQNAGSFQAWGRKGPDRDQASSLGIFFEDNVSKKRWVLKADDPKTLQDIDAVFVTAEPNGGSHHPSGKQLLFAYLRVSPNHP